MEDYQKRAWECLTEIERQSLFLQLSNGKSTWEVGTILKISHYKYLEIRERSEKFFRLFSDYFQIHEAIFRPDSPCEEAFRDYIEGVIEKRLTRKQASLYMGDSANIVHKIRVRLIERNLVRLKESENPWDRDTLALIFEFDRWNNFRILPKILQQPSAYKRRVNKKDKVYIKYLLERVPDWVHEKIIERFRYRTKQHIQKYWICLISPILYKETSGYKLLPIRPTEESITEMNRFFIYVFKDKEDADTFGFMVNTYLDKTTEVKMGQKFWPEYRYIIQKAINYKEVNNIDLSVKTLDMAYNSGRSYKRKTNKPD